MRLSEVVKENFCVCRTTNDPKEEMMHLPIFVVIDIGKSARGGLDS